MELVFEDHRLAFLLTPDASATKLSVALVKAARRKLQLIAAATDERDLRNLKSLNYEKLKGKRSGQRSIRLNKQFRLILVLDDSRTPSRVIVVGIEDYH